MVAAILAVVGTLLAILGFIVGKKTSGRLLIQDENRLEEKAHDARETETKAHDAKAKELVRQRDELKRLDPSDAINVLIKKGVLR